MSKKNLKYYKRIAGFLAGEMNAAEKQSLNNEMKNNESLKQDFDLMKKSWNEFEENSSDKYSDTDKPWNVLKNRLDEDGILENESTPARVIKLRYAMRIAAIALIVLSIGIPTVYLSIKEISTQSDYFEHSAINGTETVDLPDGSRVFLNEGANLRYDDSFDEKREVTLKGEGYFDVMEDPSKPFHVNAGKVIITVLGTAFNVKNYLPDQTEVFVESGSVKVTMKNSDEEIILKQGQMARANEAIRPDKLNDINYLSWKTKEFRFIDQPLPEILDVLEKAYHVKVDDSAIENDDMRLTTTYQGQTFDAVLNTICAALEMQYEKDGKVYILQTN